MLSAHWWTVFLRLGLSLWVREALASPILPAHLTLKEDTSYPAGGQVKPGRLAPGMRPSPSDDLPVEPPDYPEDQYNVPGPQDLNSHKLKKLLGEKLDSAFMSSVQPLESILQPNGTLVYDFKGARPKGRMPPELRALTLSLPGKRKKKVHFKGRKTRRRLQRFLWAYSYCPVHYQWKDLGARFWPRWLRAGSCYKGRSCSLPAGMTCKTRESTMKTVLWWYCSQDRARHRRCKWIHIKYPIITKCECTC